MEQGWKERISTRLKRSLCFPGGFYTLRLQAS